MKVLSIAGRLGNDAEVRYTGNGDAVASFDVAVDEKIKGEKVTTWVRCSVWGERAEKIAPFLTKGSAVAVTGDARATAYMPKDSDKPRAQLECRVDKIAFLGGGERQDGSGKSRQRAQRQAPGRDDVPDDDIPF